MLAYDVAINAGKVAAAHEVAARLCSARTGVKGHRYDSAAVSFGNRRELLCEHGHQDYVLATTYDSAAVVCGKWLLRPCSEHAAERRTGALSPWTMTSNGMVRILPLSSTKPAAYNATHELQHLRTFAVDTYGSAGNPQQLHVPLSVRAGLDQQQRTASPA